MRLLCIQSERTSLTLQPPGRLEVVVGEVGVIVVGPVDPVVVVVVVVDVVVGADVGRGASG